MSSESYIPARVSNCLLSRECMAHKSSSKHWRNPRLEKPSLLHVLCHSHPQVLRLEITAPPTLESTHIIISYK